jgi:hypothetical protein
MQTGDSPPGSLRAGVLSCVTGRRYRMYGIRFLIALAAVALAAFVAAAPASPQLNLGTPLDDDGGVTLPKVRVGGGGGGAGGGGGTGGNAVEVDLSAGDTSAHVEVACIDAEVLDITAKIGSCDRGRRDGGAGGGRGNRDAVDAGADAGDVDVDAGVGCVDIGLGDLGDGLQIGSCEAIMPPPGGGGGDVGGSGELPAQTGSGVAGAGDGDGADGSGGDGADCIAFDEVSSAGMPYGIPPWLAGLVAMATFGLGAFVARRRRPQAEDVAG